MHDKKKLYHYSSIKGKVFFRVIIGLYVFHMEEMLFQSKIIKIFLYFINKNKSFEITILDSAELFSGYFM